MQENDSNAQNTTPLVDQAKDTAKQAVQQGQEVAEKAVDNVRGQMRQQITTQKDKAASSLGQVANAVFLTSKNLRDQGQGAIGDYTDRLGTRISDVSDYLERHELDEVAAEVSEFARRKPAVFVASAVLLGVLASRFLKSSSHRGTYNGTTPNPIAPYDEKFAQSQTGFGSASTAGVGAGTGSGFQPDTYDAGSDLQFRTSDTSTDARPNAMNDLRDDTTPLVSSGNLDDTPTSAGTDIEEVTVIMSQDALDDDDELLEQSPIGARSSNAV